MLILPNYLGFCKAGALHWRRGRIGNLRDKICSGGFGNTIHENADEWSFQSDCKCKSEAEEHTLTVTKPALLLLRSKLDSTEVGIQLCMVSSYHLR